LDVVVEEMVKVWKWWTQDWRSPASADFQIEPA